MKRLDNGHQGKCGSCFLLYPIYFSLSRCLFFADEPARGGRGGRRVAAGSGGHSGSRKRKKKERRDVSTHSDLLFLHLRHWASGPSRSGLTFDLLPPLSIFPKNPKILYIFIVDFLSHFAAFADRAELGESGELPGGGEGGHFSPEDHRH
jgi:hypothetical protein